MAISHINGISATSISHFNTIAKANISAIHGITASFGGGGGYDTDAQTFFTATGITDNTIKDAIDDLVVALKGYSIWTKFDAIYPFVGGSSSTHAVNLKSPGTFDITWSGTVTHDSNGVTGNGSTGYGNTGWNQSTHGTDDNEHLSVYSRTNVSESSTAIGLRNTGPTRGSYMRLRVSDLFETFSITGTSHTIANTDSRGYFSMNRTASTGYRKRKNTTNTDVTQNSDVALQNLNVFICARNEGGTAAAFSTQNLAWAAIGEGLTETEDGNCQTAVETFQDALGRGVVA